MSHRTSTLIVSLAAVVIAAVPNVSLAADAFTITAPLASKAVSSCGDLTMSGGIVDSETFSGSVTGSNGDMLSNGSIKVSGGTVNGNATPGPGKSVTLSGSGKVTGSIAPATATYDCRPIDLTALATALQTTNDDATIPLTLAKKNVLGGTTHTDFTLGGGDTLTLAAGTYYFTKFTVSGGSIINVTGPVRILTTGAVDISGGSFTNTSPYQLRLWTSATTFFLSGGSKLAGYVYAPSATATVSASTLNGGIFANSVTISGSAHVTRNVDNVPPQVAITAPANGATATDPSHVSVSGTVSDDIAVTLQVNGQPVTPNADGTWQITLNLSGAPSPVTITAVATDAAGNTKSASVSVSTIQPPVITLTSPANGTWVNARLVTLSGSAGNAATVTVNGQAATISNGTWTLANFDLGPDGQHPLAIVGTNAGGSTTLTPAPILYSDTVAPAVDLRINNAAVTEGEIYSTAANVTVAVTDNLNHATSTTVIDTTTVNPPTSIAAEGQHTIAVTAVDQANNTTSITRHITIDTSAPVIAILANGQPLTSGQTFRTAPSITFSANDLTLDSVTAMLNGQPFTSGAPIAAEGSYDLKVHATDKAGHASDSEVTFIFRSGAPAVQLLANGNAFHDGMATKTDVTFTLIVDDSTTTHAVVTIDGGTAAQTVVNLDSTTYSQGTTVKAEAAHTISVVVTNAANLSSTIGGGFVIDRTPPALTITESGTPFADNGRYDRAINPVVTATDNLATPSVSLYVDGALFPPNQSIANDSATHTLYAVAADAAGNSTTSPTFHFIIDQTPPVITIAGDAGNPIPPALAVTHPLNVTIKIVDITPVSVTATLNGGPLDLGSGTKQSDGALVFTKSFTDGSYSLSVSATDLLNHVTTAPAVTFSIDTTPPDLQVTAPHDGDIVATPSVVVSGTAGDAKSVTVNGAAAAIAPGTPVGFSATVQLAEGSNDVVVVATDAAGNATAPRHVAVTLDSHPPSIAIDPLAGGSCTNATSLQLTGSATDANLSAVTVALGSGGAPVTAAFSNGTWSATLPLAGEGSDTIVVTATDSVKHTATATLPITVDRTRPVIQLSSGGSAFTAGAINHAVAITARAVDADPNAAIAMTIAGAPYVAGTILTDGSYTLVATASDCAGNSASSTVSFTVDTVAPSVVSIDPANGSTIGLTKAISGIVKDADLKSVVIDGSGVAASVSGTSFTFNVPLQNGANPFVFVLTDNAGNVTRYPYSVTLKSSTPSVEIDESGAPIASNAVFNRAVTPVIKSSEAAATTAATVTTGGGSPQPFTSGTTLSNDGSYSITATATDAYGHSSTATVAFTIDRSAPDVHITSPANGATVGVAQISVNVTSTAADVVRVTINNFAAQKGSGGSYTAAIPLDLGANTIVAVAVDAAGNSATDQISVTRSDSRPGIVITSPGDGTTTNRRTTTVAGQLLTPTAGAQVTINGTNAPLDAAGAFRLDDFALIEGDNSITAALAGTDRKVVVHVVADFTPPVLKVLANGSEMTQGQHFDTAPTIALQASDTSGATPATTLSIDGIDATSQMPVLANGGHALTATATDAAHNATRIDRTFTIGPLGSGAGAGCTFSEIAPANQSVVLADSVTVTGRTTAAHVKVNGVNAQLDSGSFAATIQLQSGANAVTIQCVDANGTPTADTQPDPLTYYRSTSSPAIAITSPAKGAVVTATTVTVTGTVGADVVSGDVNGIAFTPSGGAFSVPNVSVASGLNILTARGRNSAGAVGAASVAVTVVTGAPKLVISSPLPGTQTGAATLDVTGTFANGDSTTTVTITSSGAPIAATTTPLSDTTGTFSAPAVPLATTGTTHIVVTVTNAAHLSTSASVDVAYAAGPSITIALPLDNTFYRSDAAGPDAIRGTIGADPGSVVQVNGADATVSGNNFTASIAFSGTNNVVPIVARVTTPGNASAIDAIRVLRLAGPLAVRSSFPEANATGVDIGAVEVLLFSNPVNSRTAANAVTLVRDDGTQITGTLYVDNDAVSFAPGAPLTPGTHYTLKVSQALADVAGGTLASAFSTGFTTAATAPASVPSVNGPQTITGCFSTATLTGTASAPGARIRVTVDGNPNNVAAATDKTFAVTFSFSGEAGFHVARVTEIGPDGSVSPEYDVTYRIDCAAPQVVAATLDRSAKTLVIRFSTAMNAASLTASATGTIRLTASAAPAFSGTVAMNATGDTATVTYADDLTPALTLTVSKSVTTAGGATLGSDFVQSFDADSQQPGGSYVSGAVYDASSGRPLQSASVSINPGAIAFTTDAHGRYVKTLGEGAYTIEVTAAGYAKVWRQIVVPDGTGVVPIDIRLTRRDTAQQSGSALTLSSGGGDATKPIVARHVTLTVPAAALPSGHTVALTAVGGQSLAGLLPLGWSPYAAAEVVVDDAPSGASLAGSALLFDVSATDASAIAAASQTLSVVQYDPSRDEWRTIVPVATIAATSDSNVKQVSADILAPGNYALVYPDRAAGLARPEDAHGGTALQGVPNPCGATPAVCSMPAGTFTLDPKTVTPTQRSTATLITDGTTKSYPSGTAVQAYIDEQLNLADGTVRIDPPFATDLLLYRGFDGTSASSIFYLAPTTTAATVTLRDGADHVHVVDYPGRIDRGALIGAEGGRVPGDDTISIDIPTGATVDPIHASLASTHDSGTLPGFHIVGGFTLSLSRADNAQPIDVDGDGKPDLIPAVTLLKPVRGTFTVDAAKFTAPNQQIVIAEVLGSTPNGKVIRVASATTPAATQAPGVKIFTTINADPSVPVDGIIREGQYFILAADAPIAYAYGTVRTATAGPSIADALVQSGIGSAFAPALGVADESRIGGGFTVPVAAQPASPFSLRAHTASLGDGQPVPFASSPAADAWVAFGDLILAPQPPRLQSLTPASGATNVDPSTLQIQATFDVAIDSASAQAGMVVNNLTTGVPVAGSVSVAGSTLTFNPTTALASGCDFTVALLPSIRATSGAAFARSVSSTFSTKAAPPANANINTSLIQITIPVNGVSVIRGAAGALPGGDRALAVRRSAGFVVQYQATASADGSFSFNAGNGATDDRITTSDAIDLQIIDRVSNSVILVLPLTPFVTQDGLGFIAPADRDTTFTAAQPVGVTVRVPAGAFPTPTLLTIGTPAQSDFTSAVASFSSELVFDAGVTLSFDGTAQKPIDVDIPVPQSITSTTGRQFLLGRLGESVLGPHVEIDDLLQISGTSFTTRNVSGSTSLRLSATSLKAGRNDVQTGGAVRDYLMHVITGGRYAVTEIAGTTPVSWVLSSGLQSDLDIFWSSFHSLYVSQLYITAGHGRVVMPVISNSPFSVDGVDAATGIRLFSHNYDGPPVAPPGQAGAIPPLASDTVGPYPVFASPFNVQVVDIPHAVTQLNPTPALQVQLPFAPASDSGQAQVSFVAAADANDPPRHLQVLNPNTGDAPQSLGSPIGVNVTAGDRIIIAASGDPVDPRSDLSVVFNEPLYIPSGTADVSAYLRQYFVLESYGPSGFRPFDSQITMMADSGNRRVQIHAPLESGIEYRLTIGKSLPDEYNGAAGLTLGASAAHPGQIADDLRLFFFTRKPKGDILGVPFTIAKGAVRDLALDGNLLFVSALEGGLLAYDASDPAGLQHNPPIARALAIPDVDSNPPIAGQSWAIDVDHHGRVWTTAVTSEFGVIRTFRTEQFANAAVTPPPSTIPVVTPFAGGNVSWRPGATVGLDTGFDTTILSDRPEATPRKMQIVVQDDTLAMTGANIDAMIGGPNLLSVTGTRGVPQDDFGVYHLEVPASIGTRSDTTTFQYLTQRITVRNVTLGLRWSRDVNAGPANSAGNQKAIFDGVLVRSGDTIRVERNMATYGVVSLFGYGIGMYDLNAVESNSLFQQGAAPSGTDYAPLATQVAITTAGDQLTFSPDAAATVETQPATATAPAKVTVHAFALVPTTGIVTVNAQPIGNAPEANGTTTSPGSDVTTSTTALAGADGLPELATIKQIVSQNGARPFNGRFNSVARYDRGNINYILVSGGQYGILVFDVTTAGNPMLADIIWIPGGAFAVRTIGGSYATAVEGDGRALLIDLTNIDERALPRVDVSSLGCTACTPLFPSVAAALRGGPGADPYHFGTDDPRLAWRSEIPTCPTSSDPNAPCPMTTLAPVGDPDTGLLFDGALLQSAMHVLSAIDPHIAMMVNLGGGKLTEVTAVSPLGVASVSNAGATLPPCQTSGADTLQPTGCRENVSLGVFRLEASLPGSLSNALGANPQIAIESERIPGATSEQTQAPIPPSHLRQYAVGASSPDARATPFSLQRVIKDNYPNVALLKLQKGYNKYVSPWIVAIADPRASSQYAWPAGTDKEDAGCFSCTIPPFIAGAHAAFGTPMYEIYTNGRALTVRPEATTFANAGAYAYLGDKHRIFARFGTIMADTVRPPKALVAANAPPVAGGKLLETIYLHSGEVETSAVDLDAGGRAGWNVVFDRTYRSQTVGATPLGFGWDSGMFKRLRFLPNGDVEYRDGSGEVWRYRLNGNAYVAPAGYFARLLHSQVGWTLIDQKRRITYFDELGRLVREADEFYTPDGKGNAIAYVYGADGRLSKIVDPNNRANSVEYGNDGFVSAISDWRDAQRRVTYVYDAGRLTEVHLPTFMNAGGASLSPVRKYGYDTASTASVNDVLELSTNLTTITDPFEVAHGGPPRVTFSYGGSNPRDYVAGETWGTGEQVSLGYLPGQAVVVDTLGQRRTYALNMPPAPASKTDWYTIDRAHIGIETEENITVAAGDYGHLPSTPPAPTASPATTTTSRITTFAYAPDGTPQSVAIAGGPTTTFSYQPVSGELGMVLSGTTISGGPAAPVVTTYHYRGGDSALLDSVEINGQRVEQHEPDRSQLSPTDNNSVTTASSFDAATGLPLAATTQCAAVSGCSSASAGSTMTINYPPGFLPKFKRGLPDHVTEGSDGANQKMTTLFTYVNEDTTRVTDARGITTTTEYDSWHRPRSVTAIGPGQTLHEEWDYDENGRVQAHRRDQGTSTVTTTFAYDVVGRTTSATTDHIAADGSRNSTVTISNDYSQFAARTIKNTGAGNAVTTVTLDSLGRAIKTTTSPGLNQSDIVKVTTYDIADNAVYTSDTDTFASAMGYDAAGRRTDVEQTDGTAMKFDLDGFGRPRTEQHLDRNGHAFLVRSTTFQPDGQVASVTESGDHGSRTSARTWDGGGRTAAIGLTGGDEAFAMQRQFDDAGRLQASKRGGGDVGAVDAYTQTTFSRYGGSDLAPSITSRENKAPAPPSYQTSLSSFDTLGNAQSITVGSLAWGQQFDQAGHPTSATAPGRPAKAFSWDARGALTVQTHPDGSTQSYDYDKNGSRKLFVDPTREQTQTTVDLLGRPVKVTYADTTSEEIVYQGARIAATKDREERWRSFVYQNGHLTQVWATQNGASANQADQLDQIDYDAAGRITAWTTPDTRLELSDFTLDGQPQKSVQIRYKNAMGLQHPQPSDLYDQYQQTHGYNGAGQRTTFSVPPGSGAAGLTSLVTQHYDPLGNLKTLTTDTGLALNATYRDAGRPMTRTLSLPSTSGSPKLLARSYDYRADTGQLLELRVSVDDPASGASAIVAGSRVGYDGLQVADAQLLGVSSGTRHTRYSYDVRSRVAGSVTAAAGTTMPPLAGGRLTAPGTALDTPDAADFRMAQTRQPLFDAPTSSLLTQLHFDVPRIDPPSLTVAPALPGHKITSFARGTTTRNVGYFGSDVIDDGAFVYHYDRKGRLDWTAQKSDTAGATIRRIVYALDGRDRIVGRTAQSATVTSVPADYGNLQWQTEARADVLAHDGLPAETTFIWDAVSDRLLTVMRAGASFVPNDVHANVVKQFIHGDMGYDDPLEVASVNADSSVTKLYPVFNEAAGGELQAVLNANGEVVARSVNNDPYGSAEFDLSGAAIDRVTVSATKDNSGTITSVSVTMRATEQLASATVANGARLAVVDSGGTLIRTAPAAAALDPADPFTMSWTMSGSDWVAFSDPSAVTIGGVSRTPASLSIGATSTLRAAVWAVDVPVLAAPAWATATRPVFTSASLPFEDRESLGTISSFVSSVPTGDSRTNVTYDIPTLSLAGTDTTNPYIGSLFVAPWQAHPFLEPFNGKQYVRARWYDPATGSWLSPDPLGYRDSSNLYAFSGGDPVNGRDPTGQGKFTDWAMGELEEKVGNAVALADAGVGYGEALFRPDLIVQKKVVDTYGRVKRVVQAYNKGGVNGATKQYVAEEKAFLKTLPFVRTYEAAKQIPKAAKKGRFQQGLQTGRAAISAAGDIALVVAPFAGGAASAEVTTATATAEVPAATAEVPAVAGVEEGPFIYRGVHADHPAMADALEGRVVPGDVNGTVTPAQHNRGGVAADSPYTSWSHNYEEALYHATKRGPGGVILRVPIGAPPPGATWSWEFSPNAWYDEMEVLLKGVREGATVIKP